MRAAVNTKAQSAAATAPSALKETGENVRAAVNTKAQTAAAAVQRPITAVGDTVQAGRRRVRRGVRLVRVALWAGSIGVVIGLLLAKTSGAELRRQLRALVSIGR